MSYILIDPVGEQYGAKRNLALADDEVTEIAYLISQPKGLMTDEQLAQLYPGATITVVTQERPIETSYLFHGKRVFPDMPYHRVQRESQPTPPQLDLP